MKQIISYNETLPCGRPLIWMDVVCVHVQNDGETNASVTIVPLF